MRKRSAATATTESEEQEVLEHEARSEVKPPKRYDFKSVHVRSNKDSELRDDVVEIVETVFLEDIRPITKRAKDFLFVGKDRSEHGVLVKKLDEGRQLCYEMHCVYVSAKREVDRWELENESVFSASWNSASRELEAEREAKTRTKAITDTDTRSKILTMHPDEFIGQETKRKAVKLMLENITHLLKLVGEKCEDIRTFIAKLR